MTPIRRSTSLPRRLLVSCAAAAALAFATAPTARAEDGEGGTEALEQEIRAQMEKVLTLMRENQQAILKAAHGGGGKSSSVDVTVPPAPESGAKAPPTAMGEPPPAGGSSGGGAGDDARKTMEELIRATSEAGGIIPGEIESLIKLIPVSGGGGGGGGGEDPQNSPQRRDLPDPDDAQSKKKDPSGDPKDPQKRPDKPDGSTKPPEGGTGDPSRSSEPAWFAELPAEYRRAIVTGQADALPPRYRPLIERFRRWLAEKATPSR
ncbi:MAG: hypothetical protein IT460_14625 [Planctomycetes bacterium]|nr:hypothetical protein [Planctomycetota bacterium]